VTIGPLLIDTWESGGAVDEALLFASGVSGMLVRLNEYDPGTNSWFNRDDNFDAQWEQAKQFPVRIPYFVFDPKATGHVNYSWLAANMPADAGAVSIDIEVRNSNITATEYAKKVADCIAEARNEWNVMRYTGGGYVDLLASWPADEKTWWAWYPFALYPDDPKKMSWDNLRYVLSTIILPTGNIPGIPVMWQCTGDRLIMDGCEKPMDVNVWLGTMDELVAFANVKTTAPAPLPGDTHSTPYPGVEFYKAFRYNSWCHVLLEQPDHRQHVTPPAYKVPSQVARELGAQTVINGGYSDGLHYSEGVKYHAQNAYEPFVSFAIDQSSSINAYNISRAKWNALGGKRFIVQAGKQAPNTSASWSEVHPRTLIGVRADGRVVKCVIDGRQPGYSVGVDLYQGAAVMIEFGCVTAMDLDGGGSSCMVVGGVVVNSPIDNGVPGKERAVINHIASFADGAAPPPPTGGTMDTYQVIVAVKPRPTPEISGGTSANVAAGTQFSSDTVVAGLPAGTNFVKYTTGEWLPLIYNGVEYVKKMASLPAGVPFTLTVEGFLPESGTLIPS
jgi:hypothetical protein